MTRGHPVSKTVASTILNMQLWGTCASSTLQCYLLPVPHPQASADGSVLRRLCTVYRSVITMSQSDLGLLNGANRGWTAGTRGVKGLYYTKASAVRIVCSRAVKRPMISNRLEDIYGLEGMGHARSASTCVPFLEQNFGDATQARFYGGGANRALAPK